MKINSAMQKVEIEFDLVKPGDVFLWGDDFYLKMANDADQNMAAVNLATGSRKFLSHDLKVSPVRVELDIKGYAENENR